MYIKEAYVWNLNIPEITRTIKLSKLHKLVKTGSRRHLSSLQIEEVNYSNKVLTFI
jgi:hypothetical protein